METLKPIIEKSEGLLRALAHAHTVPEVQPVAAPMPVPTLESNTPVKAKYTNVQIVSGIVAAVVVFYLIYLSRTKAKHKEAEKEKTSNNKTVSEKEKALQTQISELNKNVPPQTIDILFPPVQPAK